MLSISNNKQADEIFKYSGKGKNFAFGKNRTQVSRKICYRSSTLTIRLNNICKNTVKNSTNKK